MNSILRITDLYQATIVLISMKILCMNRLRGTNLNASGQDIRFTIDTQDIFTHPSESFF